MRIAAELTLTPLQEDFKTPIKRFIERLKTYQNIEVIQTPLSTQIYGEYDTIMHLLHREGKNAFVALNTAMLQIKLVKKENL